MLAAVEIYCALIIFVILMCLLCLCVSLNSGSASFDESTSLDTLYNSTYNRNDVSYSKCWMESVILSELLCV